MRYVRNAKNVGVARNFNGLFRLASGRYFKWAPHDDVLAPEFLARCVDALDADPAVAIAVPGAAASSTRPAIPTTSSNGTATASPNGA